MKYTQENEIEYYNKKKSYGFITWFFIGFIFLMLFLIYFAFFNNGNNSLTGSVVNSLDDETSANIKATLGIPQKLNFEEGAEKIELSVKTPSFIEIGNKKVNFLDSKRTSSIIIYNFKGDLDVDLKNIIKLKGNCKKIYVEGVPLESESLISIELKQNSGYSSLSIDNTKIRNLNYNSSGIINIDNNRIILNLNNENVNLKSFIGDVDLNNNKMILNGKISKSIIKNLLESQ